MHFLTRQRPPLRPQPDTERLAYENFRFLYSPLNELGYGGLLAEAPSIERTNQGYEVHFILEAEVPRRDASKIKTLCADTLKRLEGLEAIIPICQATLGMACGTWFADLDRGSDVSDIYWRYLGSPWFAGLVTMEMIRLSSIPSKPLHGSDATTPMACVNRINRVEIPSFELTDHRLPISVDIELEGIGNWNGTLLVFISSSDELLGKRTGITGCVTAASYAATTRRSHWRAASAAASAHP